MTIAEVLLSAIKESGQTQGQISYGSGVWQSTLCRFIHRKRGLTLDVADKLAAYFHLELRKVQ